MESPETDEAYLSTLSVLCVEDEELVLDQEARFLGRRCREVLLARTGREGLELFRSRRPDLVVTDLHLPEMNGLELTAAIRALEPGLPILAVTAMDRPEVMDEARSLGIDLYLVKPVRVGLLHQALVAAAGRLRRSRDGAPG